MLLAWCGVLLAVLLGFLGSRGLLRVSRILRRARSSSRRWIMVTLVAKRVRKRASSMAVSPPPTTTTSSSQKKAPSHVAQELKPCPSSLASDSSPKYRGLAPAAIACSLLIFTLGVSATLAFSSPKTFSRTVVHASHLFQFPYGLRGTFWSS